MKKSCFWVIIFMLNCGIAFSQKGIDFSETAHNFETISEGGGRVEHQFIVSNNTNIPLLIKNVTSPCECTSSKWTKKPIDPGKTGFVDVIYNPSGRIGHFFKVISVYTNQSANPLSLTIKGDVVTAEKANSLQSFSKQDYPYTFGNYSLESKKLNFGRMDINESKTIKLRALNISKSLISQKVKNLPKGLTVVFDPESIPAKETANIAVTLNTTHTGVYGNVTGEFYIIADGVSVPITYSATIMDDFTKWTTVKKRRAGKIMLNASEINFGNFISGNTRTLKITNSGMSVLHIRNIQSSDNLISITPSVFNISPNETTEVKLYIDSRRVKTNLKSTLTVVSDDPETPISKITITAKPK